MQYTPTISGIYSLNVTYQSQRFDPPSQVKGSPFMVTVEPARTSAARSPAWGRGLTAGMTGTQQNFTIKAVDAFGNNRHVGGDAIEVIAYHHNKKHVDYGVVQVRRTWMGISPFNFLEAIQH